MRPAQLGESARGEVLRKLRLTAPSAHGGPLSDATTDKKSTDTTLRHAFPSTPSEYSHARRVKSITLCIMKTSWLRARQRSAHPFRVSAAASSSPAATCRSRFSALRYRRPGSGYPRLIRSNWHICALVPRPCPREWTGYRGRCQTPPRMQPERRQRAAE